MPLKPQLPKYHTPIILRFGILHSYWRTLPLLAFIFFADLALQWLAGIPVGWIPVLTNLAALLGIWAIRDTVAGYADLFDVFDSKIEQKLKLYKTMIRPPCPAKDDIRNLFKDSGAYKTFREKVRRNLFQRTELWAFVFASVSFILWNGYSLIFEWSRAPRVGAFPWVEVRFLLNMASSYLMTLFVTSAIVLVFGYLGAVSLLGQSSMDLRIWSYIRYLRGEAVTGGAFMSYEAFHENASTLGRYVYRITLRIVLLEVLAALAAIISSLINQGVISLSAWFFAFAVIIASVAIFLSPLFSLHRVLARAKKAVLQVYEGEYEHLKVRFMSEVRELRTTGNARRHVKSVSDVGAELSALQTILAETRSQRTWAVGTPMVAKVVGTSLIPVIIAVLEALGALGTLVTLLTFLPP